MKLKSKEERKGEKVFRYSIRKYHFGAASVAVAALMFFANGTVQAQTPDISPATESGTTRTSALVSDSSGGGVSEELSEKTPDTDPSQPEQPIQGNRENQEASDKNKSLVKDSEEGKGEKQAEEASRPTVDKSLAESAQTSLQALLANLTLDSMKELHARVEAGLAQAKAVLENPNSSQEEVNAQVQAMKTLTEEVNKALAGGLTSPAELGEGSGVTQSEPSPTPRRGRGRRGQLTPPTAPVSTENQETKETAEEITDYTNGSGSYPLSDKIHHLLQELKTSTENPEQVQKLKEAYDKLNEALGQSENGLVNQEVFNAALEEYKKTTQLKNGVEKGSSDSPKSRKARSADNSLKIGFGKGTTSVPQYSEETLRTLSTGEAYGNNLRVTVKSFSGETVRSITVNGLEGTGLSQTGLTLTNGLGYVDLRGRMPDDKHGYTRVTVVATDSSGNTNQTTLTIARPLPEARITTTNKELEGKAETKPIISGTIGVRAEPGNTPDGAELMAYLVRGGSPNPYSYNNEAQGYHTIAKTRVTVSGTFNFVPPEYRDPKLGERDVRVVVAYVRRGTDETFSEGMKSGFSTNSVRATAPINKSNLSTKIQELETELNKPVSTDGKTEDS
ncbi:YSIRK-type signal peptide-containing protein, partial [Streptococcus pneumoniae]